MTFGDHYSSILLLGNEAWRCHVATLRSPTEYLAGGGRGGACLKAVFLNPSARGLPLHNVLT